MTEQNKQKLENKPIATKVGAVLVSKPNEASPNQNLGALKTKVEGLHSPFPICCKKDDIFAGCCYEE